MAKMDSEEYIRAKNRLDILRSGNYDFSNKERFRRDDFATNFIPERLNVGNLSIVALT